MRILVTGATGFVGRHVVQRLVKDGHTVTAVGRDMVRAQALAWFDSVNFLQCDLHIDAASIWDCQDLPDVLLHLAWPGLPNYKDFFHIGKNLPADLAFLQSAVTAGIRHIVVAGTCLEYGLQYGALTEEAATRPTTPYGFAKDTLRKALQLLQQHTAFKLQWLRLFYMYGAGQNRDSLLSQLDRAIDSGAAVFNMSNGDQLRDYLPIETVAENFALAIQNPQCDGVINCCSGQPMSVLDLVSKHCQLRASRITLNRGYYPYPDYEPLAFWGVPAKLNHVRTRTSAA